MALPATIMERPEKMPMVIHRYEYIQICKEAPDRFCAAAILNTFEYWTGTRISKLNPEQVVAEFEKECTEVASLYWVFKSYDELRSDLLDMYGRNTVIDNTQWLVDQGFLARRNNPFNPWDKKFQYVFCLKCVVNRMKSDGLFLNCRESENKLSEVYNQTIGSLNKDSRQAVDKLSFIETTDRDYRPETTTEKKTLSHTPVGDGDVDGGASPESFVQEKAAEPRPQDEVVQPTVVDNQTEDSQVSAPSEPTPYPGAGVLHGDERKARAKAAWFLVAKSSGEFEPRLQEPPDTAIVEYGGKTSKSLKVAKFGQQVWLEMDTATYIVHTGYAMRFKMSEITKKSIWRAFDHAWKGRKTEREQFDVRLAVKVWKDKGDHDLKGPNAWLPRLATLAHEYQQKGKSVAQEGQKYVYLGADYDTGTHKIRWEDGREEAVRSLPNRNV